jgi:hypothetical protein
LSSSGLKKFYLCKLCLIVFGALLAVLIHRESLAGSHTYPQTLECEGQSSISSRWHQGEKIQVSIESDAIRIKHVSATKPYIFDYDLHSFQVDGFDFLVGKRVDVSGTIGLSGSTLSIANGTVFVDLAERTVLEDNYNFRPADGASSLDERGAFWIKYKCKEI